MPRSVFAALLLVVVPLALCGKRVLGQSAPEGPVHAVTHVDFMPDHLQAVSELERYVAEERRDPKVEGVELLQQIGAGNHFTLIETFHDMAAYNAHTEAQSTRRFRAGIVDALGSPFDERLFRDHATR